MTEHDDPTVDTDASEAAAEQAAAEEAAAEEAAAEEASAEEAVTEEAAAEEESSHAATADGENASDEASEEPVADSGDESAEGAAGADQDESERPSKIERLEREGDIAADYLEELLDIADLDGDLDMDVEGDRAIVSVVGADLSQLVGRDGEVLEALQELTRLAVFRETGERSRLMLDVSGYRAQRREELVAVAAQAIERVRESGGREALDPMSAFERKVVHDEVAAAGLVSESEGAEPRRFVVILPE